MKKTIDFTSDEIEKVKAYQKNHKIKNFSDALKQMLFSNEESAQNFALLADAILIMDEKVDMVLSHFAPKAAGEVKTQKEPK